MMDLRAGWVKWSGTWATSVLLSVGYLTSGVSEAQTGVTASDTRAQIYNIKAQALGAALQEFAAQAGLQLLFSESDVAGMRTAGLQGRFTKDQALERLLAGSGLSFEFPKADAVIVRRPVSSSESSPAHA